MDKLWTPIFTLLGVLIGGFFTYLGLRAQLKQQKQISSTEWRRKVRSEPLLKLRNELAIMASKNDEYSGEIFLAQVESSLGNEGEARKRFERAARNFDVYSEKRDTAYTIYLQSDLELIRMVDDIRINYPRALSFSILLDTKKFIEVKETIKKIREKIAVIQELINKKLDEL